MRKKKIILGVILTILGLIGIASILTMNIPLPAEAEAILKGKFTDEQIKLFTLINPTIMLLGAVIVGTIFYQKVDLRVPLIEKIVGIENGALNLPEILKYGISGGVLAGILVSFAGLLFNPMLPTEFKELGESLQPTIAARFLYGGITEEILMRFGLMTFVVWLCSKIFSGTKPIVYSLGIIVAAIIFALGHFPIAYQAVGNPTPGLLTYILIGNSVGGIIFGWLYWKKGLESGFIAHIFAHVILLLAGPILN
ncbi:abortive infection protein [Pontibacter sp. HJ8]